VRAGEIVGLAGLVGCGRTELLESLAGLRRSSAGRVAVDGAPLRLGRPRDAKRTEVASAQGVASRLRIRTDGLGAPVQTLSGGNQQKVVIGRCMRSTPRVFLLDEPTVGIDVGTRAEVYRIIFA